MEEIKNEVKTSIIYEAPHKLENTLNELKEKQIIKKRKIVIARELTKIHEEFIRGEIEEIIEKTKYIRRKYSEDFMKKFNYTLLDKIIFWAGLKGCTFPKKYFVYLLLFKIYHLFVHIIVLTLFWNRQLRRKVRKSLSINNYSFYKAEK